MNMSDLIRREDAIEAIQKRADKIDSVYSAFWEGLIIAQDIVKNIPSAEPEQEEFEWCDDCKEYDQEQHCCHRWTKVIRQTVEEVKAQYALEYPKIIHCEDCKFYTPMNRELKIGLCSLRMHNQCDDGFCSDAEKRGE